MQRRVRILGLSLRMHPPRRRRLRLVRASPPRAPHLRGFCYRRQMASSALSIENRKGTFAGVLWLLRGAVVVGIGVARVGIGARLFSAVFRYRFFF
jgi:hypothetical protein